MPLLAAGALLRDIDLVLFDKDGTLLDFHRLWAPRTARAVEALAAAAGRPDLAAPLGRTIGLDETGARIRPETPMAVASIAANTLVAATVLHQGGLAWHAAETLARTHFAPPLTRPPGPDELAPVGDVLGLLRRLTAAGVKLGIVTTDDRAGSEATVARLGWAPYLVGLSCGDDPWPAKPDARALTVLCERAGVAAVRTLMVGDSLGDMAAARAAGCAALAVLSGTGEPAALAAAADATVDSVEALRLA
jgi:phosphoglycolate phosphatase-like HAD superfamily hydrolase